MLQNQGPLSGPPFIKGRRKPHPQIFLGQFLQGVTLAHRIEQPGRKFEVEDLSSGFRGLPQQMVEGLEVVNQLEHPFLPKKTLETLKPLSRKHIGLLWGGQHQGRDILPAEEVFRPGNPDGHPFRRPHFRRPAFYPDHLSRHLFFRRKFRQKLPKFEFEEKGPQSWIIRLPETILFKLKGYGNGGLKFHQLSGEKGRFPPLLKEPAHSGRTNLGETLVKGLHRTEGLDQGHRRFLPYAFHPGNVVARVSRKGPNLRDLFRRKTITSFHLRGINGPLPYGVPEMHPVAYQG